MACTGCLVLHMKHYYYQHENYLPRSILALQCYPHCCIYHHKALLDITIIFSQLNNLCNRNNISSIVTIVLSPSSLKPFSQTYSLKGRFVGPVPKIFVMRGPIDLKFDRNVNWTSNFHLILIT